MIQSRRAGADRQLAVMLRHGSTAGWTDGELLEQFRDRTAEGAELAFAVLVERHGPMILRVCRAILRDEEDARDAFQGTYLILAERAHSLHGDSIASWLHEVARRTALNGRSARIRRQAHERRAAELATRLVISAPMDDLGELLHAELARLAEHHRVVVVLCDLEGLTEGQAAQQLGWPLGTVRSRLARGRTRLRERLTRRGLTPDALICFAPFTSTVTKVSVPSWLGTITVRAALAIKSQTVPATVAANVLIMVRLTQRSFLMGQIKIGLIAAMIASSVALGAAVYAQQDDAAKRNQASPLEAGQAPARGKLDILNVRHPAQGKPTPREFMDAERKELRQLQGTWEHIRTIYNDKDVPPTFEGRSWVVIDDQKRQFKQPLYPEAADGHREEVISINYFSINPAKSPKEMTIYNKGYLLQCIYELSGDELKIAHYGRSESDRPIGMMQEPDYFPLKVTTYKRVYTK